MPLPRKGGGSNFSDSVITSWVCWQWCLPRSLGTLTSHHAGSLTTLRPPSWCRLVNGPCWTPRGSPHCGPVREHRGPLMRGAPANIWLEGQEEPRSDVLRLSSSWIPNSQNQTKENGGFEATSLGVICYISLGVICSNSNQNHIFTKIILKLIQNQNHENMNITTIFFKGYALRVQGKMWYKRPKTFMQFPQMSYFFFF